MRTSLLVTITFGAILSIWAWRSDRPQYLTFPLRDASQIAVTVHTEWGRRGVGGIRREIAFVSSAGQKEEVGDYWEFSSQPRVRADIWEDTPVVFVDAAGPVAYLFARVPDGHWMRFSFDGGFTAVHESDRTVTLNCWPQKPPIKTYRLRADGSALDLVAATEEPHL